MCPSLLTRPTTPNSRCLQRQTTAPGQPRRQDSNSFILEQRRHIYNMVVRSNTDGDTLRMLPEYAQAIEHYRHSRWASAIKLLKGVSTAIGDMLSRQLIIFALEFASRKVIFRNDWGSLWDPEFGDAIVALYADRSANYDQHQHEFSVSSRRSFYGFAANVNDSSPSLRGSSALLSTAEEVEEEGPVLGNGEEKSVATKASFRTAALLRHDDPMLQIKTPATSTSPPTSPKGDVKMTAGAAMDRHGSNLLEVMIEKANSRPNSATRARPVRISSLAQLSATPGPPRTRRLSTEKKQ